MEKSLQQYLDLYQSHKWLICSNSVEGFNSKREEAFANLKVTGLPERGTENYETIDIPAMLAPDFGLNLARVPLDVNVGAGFRCGLPKLSSSLFFMLNDRFAETGGARANLPEGVEIGPLSRFLEKGGEVAKRYGSLANLANPIVSLNSLFVQEGICIHVKKGVKVERPVQIVNLLENAMPLMAVRRLLIILEEGASLCVLSCDHTSSPDIPMASLTVGEVIAKAGSRLDFYEMEESTSESRRLSALYLNQERDSDVMIGNFTLHNGQTRNEYYCSLGEEGGRLRLYGLGTERGESVVDNYSRIAHIACNCLTEELFKYTVDDSSRGSFIGHIYVAPGASGTEAFQSNRNLVGSADARIFSKPWLEIYNDDVKCSHGSATGRIDPMQLFYLRSRGLSEEEGRLLLKQAFMTDVIEGVRLPVLRDRLHTIIERHFAGVDSTCSECEICGRDV